MNTLVKSKKAAVKEREKERKALEEAKGEYEYILYKCENSYAPGKAKENYGEGLILLVLGDDFIDKKVIADEIIKEGKIKEIGFLSLTEYKLTMLNDFSEKGFLCAVNYYLTEANKDENAYVDKINIEVAKGLKFQALFGRDGYEVYYPDFRGATLFSGSAERIMRGNNKTLLEVGEKVSQYNSELLEKEERNKKNYSSDPRTLMRILSGEIKGC